MGYVYFCQTQFIHTFRIQRNMYIWILYQYLDEMRVYTNWGMMQIKRTQGTGEITLPSLLTVAFIECAKNVPLSENARASVLTDLTSWNHGMHWTGQELWWNISKNVTSPLLPILPLSFLIFSINLLLLLYVTNVLSECLKNIWL